MPVFDPIPFVSPPADLKKLCADIESAFASVSGMRFQSGGFRLIPPPSHAADALADAFGPLSAARLRAERDEAIERRKTADACIQSLTAQVAALVAERDAMATLPTGRRPKQDDMKALDCHLLFWPKELPIPYFTGDQGARRIAGWSVPGCSPTEPLSSGWHWMADAVDPVTVGLKPPADPRAFPARALADRGQKIGLRTS